MKDEQGPNDPYSAFFVVSLVSSTNRTSTDHHSGQPSHSSLPSPSPDPLPGRRLRHVFSVLRLPTKEPMRHTHFTRRVFQRRALFASPSHPPASCEQPQPTLKRVSGAVNQNEEYGNVNVSPFFGISTLTSQHDALPVFRECCARNHSSHTGLVVQHSIVPC